ncbi:hypothetical protein U91I_03478 [alpha proteobacterium U9-1i]|nr:hypothetical protein U91I_03478 [alpha proteobacterium U9-1i]
MALIWSIVLTVIVVLACTIFHYEAISRLDRFARARSWANHATLVCVLSLLMLIHVLEIVLYAGAYGFADVIGIGGLRGPSELTPAEYFIFAAETYSSLGSTDVTPEGEIRLMSSLSSLFGILSLTWSASFLFSLVERWRVSDGRH